MWSIDTTACETGLHGPRVGSKRSVSRGSTTTWAVSPIGRRPVSPSKEQQQDISRYPTRPDQTSPPARPTNSSGVVRSRTFDAGWDDCIVLDCDGIVAGRLRGGAWKADDQQDVESVMEPGPTTVRLDGVLQPLVKRMAKRGTKLVVVASPQGEFHGVLLREDAERLLTGEPPQQIWVDCEGCPGRWKVKPQ